MLPWSFLNIKLIEFYKFVHFVAYWKEVYANLLYYATQKTRIRMLLICWFFTFYFLKDALLLSVDHNGFDVLAKVLETVNNSTSNQQYHWKEFRFNFKEKAQDVESFCRKLVELEEEALERVKSYSGLGWILHYHEAGDLCWLIITVSLVPWKALSFKL